MSLPDRVFKTIAVGVVISFLLMSSFTFNSSGDVLQSMGAGTGAASSRFGWNVSYAGNVNSDGFDDVIVGAPGENKAYLFLGPVANLNPASARVTFTGPASSDFGWDVRTAFDVDGDNFDDVIIGAPGEDRAYVFFGSATISGTIAHTSAGVVLNGETGTRFGVSVCGVRDFANDGTNDVFVGAPYDDTTSGYTNGGCVFLFNDVGSRSPWTVGDVTYGPHLNITGVNDNDLFGFSISYAGNFDGDGTGLGDIVIGSPGNNTNDGAAYVEFGKPIHPAYPKGMSNVVPCDQLDQKYYGHHNNAKFGYSVSNASNFGGSSNPDVLVGAPLSGSGYAYVFYGSSSPRTVFVTAGGGADMVINGNFPGDDFGHSVTWLGDFNQDGSDDIAIGARWAAFKAGKTYVFYNPPPASLFSADDADLEITGASPGAGNGFSVSGGGVCTPAPFKSLLTSSKEGGTGRVEVFIINKAPALGGFNHFPSTGNAATDFDFYAVFTDQDNDMPDIGYPKLHLYSDSGGTSEIAGSPYSMSVVTTDGNPLMFDGKYTNGEKFMGTATIPHGTVYYMIEAKSDAGDATIIWSTVQTGPTADTVAPGRVSDLGVVALDDPDAGDEGMVKLHWTFPGDDGFDTAKVVNATLRYRNESAGNFSPTNFNESKIIEEWHIMPTPYSGNYNVEYTIQSTFGLKPGDKYYFGFRSTDEEGNWGELSNLVDTIAYEDIDPYPPPPIQNVVAEDVPNDNGGVVNLTWELSPASDLAFYRLYGGTSFFDNVGTMTPIIDNLVTGDGWQVINKIGGNKALKDGEYYYFAVTAVDGLGLMDTNVNGSWVRVLDNNAPLPPSVTGVTLTDTPGDKGGSLSVTWDATDYADFDCYKLYIEEASITTLTGKNNETAISDPATTTVKLTTRGGGDYDLKPHKKYWVAVTIESINAKENKTITSENKDGPIYPSDNSDTTGPGTISGLSASDRPDDKGGVINLVWGRYQGTLFGYYHIYISEDPITSVEGKSPEKIMTSNLDSTVLASIRDEPLVDGVPYYVAVTVVSYNNVEDKAITLDVNSVGPVESINNSDTIEPPEVEDFELDSKDDTTITFTWTPFTVSDLLDFQKYQISYYSDDEDWKTFTEDIEDITQDEFIVEGLDKKQTYNFKISAFDDNNNQGPFSEEITAKPGGANDPPDIKNVTWSPTNPTTETVTIRFSIEVVDDTTEDLDLDIQWDFTGDGETNKFGWTPDYDKWDGVGTYPFSVTVTDDEGLETTWYGNVTISKPAKADDDDSGNMAIYATVGVFAFLFIAAIVVALIVVLVIRKKKKPEEEEGPVALEPEALPPEAGPKPIPMAGGAAQPETAQQAQPMGQQPQPAAQPQPMGGAQPAQPIGQPAEQAKLPPAQDQGAQDLYGQQPQAQAQPDVGTPPAQPQTAEDLYGQPAAQPEAGTPPAADPGIPPAADPGIQQQPVAGQPPAGQPPVEDDPFAI